MKSITAECSETSQNLGSVSAIDDFAFGIDTLSSIVTESFYVIDIAANRFCYVSPNDLFLCGHSVDDALALGDDFYRIIVHPDDLPLWKNMYNTVLQHYKYKERKRYEVDYFSCTFRLQRKYSFLIRPLPQMVYHRMKPVWKDDELRYLICTVGNPKGSRIRNKSPITAQLSLF